MFGLEVNYLAIILCGIAAMVIGFLWYSNALFAKQWMKLSGITQADINKQKDNMPVTYTTMFIASLVLAYVLAHVVYFFDAITALDGAITGFYVWLGFVATTMLTGVLFESKPLKLYYINTGYHLVTMIVMGAILAGMM